VLLCQSQWLWLYLLLCLWLRKHLCLWLQLLEGLLLWLSKH
jgi:hypothetical protein